MKEWATKKFFKKVKSQLFKLKHIFLLSEIHAYILYIDIFLYL